MSKISAAGQYHIFSFFFPTSFLRVAKRLRALRGKSSLDLLGVLGASVVNRFQPFFCSTKSSQA